MNNKTVDILDKYFNLSNMGIGSITAELRYQGNKDHQPVKTEIVEELASVSDIKKYLEETTIEEISRSIYDDLDCDPNEWHLSFNIIFKPVCSIGLKEIKKDTSLPFIKQFKNLIQNCKSIHTVSLDKEFNIIGIMSDFFYLDNWQDFFSFIWHPDFLESLEENPSSFIGDFLGDEDFYPIENVKITSEGYKHLQEADNYLKWDVINLFCYMVWVDEEDNDFIEVRNPNLIVRKS